MRESLSGYLGKLFRYLRIDENGFENLQITLF